MSRPAKILPQEIAASLSTVKSESQGAQEEHQWQLYTRADETWEAQLEDCRNATRSIEMAQYIFADDDIGKRFLRLFLKKRREGLEVRLLFDSLGSGKLRKSRRLKILRRHGVRVRFFNRVRYHYYIRPMKLFPRLHSKLMLIDSRIAYAGSACCDKVMCEWRETHFRIIGPVVAQVAVCFDRLWRKRITQPVQRDINMENMIRGDRGLSIQFATSKGQGRHNAIYRQLVQQVRSAQSNIMLLSPYFIPSHSLIRLLKHATARGVKVQLLISRRTDLRFSNVAASTFLHRLLRHGIRIYQYQPEVHHTKLAIIDGKWATAGSMNLDHLSIYRNHEANFIFTQPEIVEALSSQFAKDLEQSRELTRDTIERLPLEYRILGQLGRLFRAFL